MSDRTGRDASDGDPLDPDLDAPTDLGGPGASPSDDEPILVMHEVSSASSPRSDWAAGISNLQVDRAIIKRVVNHTMEDTTLECGGILLGRMDATTGLVAVLEAIRADGATRQADSLQFTHEVIAEIHEIRERDHPELHIVGWYHSHPGYGIFLSADDQFMHRHFFDAPYQVAYVVDPVRREQGMFVWDGETIVRSRNWTRFDRGEMLAARGRPARDEAAPPPSAVPAERSTPPTSGERPLSDADTPRSNGERPSSTRTDPPARRGVSIKDSSTGQRLGVLAAVAAVLFVIGFGAGRVAGTDDSDIAASAPTTSSRGTIAEPDAIPPTSAVASSTVPSPGAPPDSSGTSSDDLLQVVAEDAGAVDALVDSWVALLAVRKEGASDGEPDVEARQVFADYVALRERYTSETTGDTVRILQTAPYRFNSKPGWAVVVGRSFESAEAANAWCDANEIGAGDCYALRLQTADGAAEPEIVTRG